MLILILSPDPAARGPQGRAGGQTRPHLQPAGGGAHQPGGRGWRQRGHGIRMFNCQFFYGSSKKHLMQISRADTVCDRVEELERQVAEAKAEAQEADKRCEDVVR